jgi:hypothetical protein
MSRKSVGWIALTTLILTSFWLILIVVDMLRAAPMNTYEAILAHAGRLNVLYYAIYIITGLLTIVTAMFMAGLYGIFRQSWPLAALCGLVLVPVYATFNLFVYLSQVTLVPALIRQQQSAPDPAVDLFLRQMLQTAPGSTLAFINALAYAVLAVPSVIFGVLMWRDAAETEDNLWGVSGLLLALSGVLSVAGFSAYFVTSPLLELGLVAGGAVFWLALFPTCMVLLRAAKRADGPGVRQ